MSSENTFLSRLNAVADDTETLLERLMASAPLEGECDRPARLLAAVRYASLGGGKRFRPFLVVESAALFGVDRTQALMTGAALECVHCYSLVHDDLPAMDNDDLRRGRPTAHKAFDDATAILAGDSLLTYAFDLLARPDTHPSAEVRIKLVLALARASGLGGMVGGQILDLAAEGRFNDVPKPKSLTEVETLQAMKTGALIRCACEMGAIAAGADAASTAALRLFGERAGKAFQLADDILDVTQSTAALGKQAAKDAGRGKATLVSLIGVAESRKACDQLLGEAIAALEPFGGRAVWLEQAARYIVGRDH